MAAEGTHRTVCRIEGCADTKARTTSKEILIEGEDGKPLGNLGKNVPLCENHFAMNNRAHDAKRKRDKRKERTQTPSVSTSSTATTSTRTSSPPPSQEHPPSIKRSDSSVGGTPGAPASGSSAAAAVTTDFAIKAEKENLAELESELARPVTNVTSEVRSQLTKVISLSLKRYHKYIKRVTEVKDSANVRLMDEQTLTDCRDALKEAQDEGLRKGPQRAVMVGPSKSGKTSTLDLLLSRTTPSDELYPTAVKTFLETAKSGPIDTLDDVLYNPGDEGVQDFVDFEYNKDNVADREVIYECLTDDPGFVESYRREGELSAMELIQGVDTTQEEFSQVFDDYSFLLVHKALASQTAVPTTFRFWCRYRVVMYTYTREQILDRLWEIISEGADLGPGESVDELSVAYFMFMTTKVPPNAMPVRPRMDYAAPFLDQERCRKYLEDRAKGHGSDLICEEVAELLGRKYIFEGAGLDSALDRAYIRDKQGIFLEEEFRFLCESQILFAPSSVLSMDGNFQDIAGVGDVDVAKDAASRAAIKAAKTIFLFTGGAGIEQAHWHPLEDTLWLDNIIKSPDQYNLHIVCSWEKAMQGSWIKSPAELHDKFRLKQKEEWEKMVRDKLKRQLGSYLQRHHKLLTHGHSIEAILERVQTFALFPRFYSAWQAHCTRQDEGTITRRVREIEAGTNVMPLGEVLRSTGMPQFIGVLVQLQQTATLRAAERAHNAIERMLQHGEGIASIDMPQLQEKLSKLPYPKSDLKRIVEDNINKDITECLVRIRDRSTDLVTTYLRTHPILRELMENEGGEGPQFKQYIKDIQARWNAHVKHIKTKKDCKKVFQFSSKPPIAKNEFSLYEIFAEKFATDAFTVSPLSQPEGKQAPTWDNAVIAPFKKLVADEMRILSQQTFGNIQHLLPSTWTPQDKRILEEQLTIQRNGLTALLVDKIGRRMSGLLEQIRERVQQVIWQGIQDGLAPLATYKRAAEFNQVVTDELPNAARQVIINICEINSEKHGRSKSFPLALVRHQIKQILNRTRESLQNMDVSGTKGSSGSLPYSEFIRIITLFRNGRFVAEDKSVVTKFNFKMKGIMKQATDMLQLVAAHSNMRPADVGVALCLRGTRVHLAVDVTSPDAIRDDGKAYDIKHFKGRYQGLKSAKLLNDASLCSTFLWGNYDTILPSAEQIDLCRRGTMVEVLNSNPDKLAKCPAFPSYRGQLDVPDEWSILALAEIYDRPVDVYPTKGDPILCHPRGAGKSLRLGYGKQEKKYVLLDTEDIVTVAPTGAKPPPASTTADAARALVDFAGVPTQAPDVIMADVIIEGGEKRGVKRPHEDDDGTVAKRAAPAQIVDDPEDDRNNYEVIVVFVRSSFTTFIKPYMSSGVTTKNKIREHLVMSHQAQFNREMLDTAILKFLAYFPDYGDDQAIRAADIRQARQAANRDT